MVVLGVPCLEVQGSGDSRFGGFRVGRVQGLESSKLG